jgi:hypothetical protein
VALQRKPLAAAHELDLGDDFLRSSMSPSRVGSSPLGHAVEMVQLAAPALAVGVSTMCSTRPTRTASSEGFTR